MLDAFPLVMPTQQGRTAGTMWPVRDARYGLVIIGDPRDCAPDWSNLYTELALYIQSAGLSVLRLDYRQPEDIHIRAFDLLDAVNALRAQGVERVLVVSRAHGGPTGAFGATAVVASFLHSVLRLSHSVGEIAERMGMLIVAISSTVESIAGTAAILTPTQERPPSARHILHQRMLDAATGTSASAHVTTRSARGLSIVSPRPGELVLRVGDEVSDEWRTRVIETVYGWCMAQVSGQVSGVTLSPRMAVRDTSEGPEGKGPLGGGDTLAALHEAQLWLDERWIDIVDDMTARHPRWTQELADRAEAGAEAAQGRAGAAGTSILEARHVWQHLDAQAREEWVAACSQLVRVLAATSGEFAPRGHTRNTHRQLQRRS